MIGRATAATERALGITYVCGTLDDIRVVLTLVKVTVGWARYLPTRTLVARMQEAGFRPGVVQRIATNRWVPSVHLVEGLAACRT